MEAKNFHPEIETRLADMARDIAILRQKLSRAQGFERIERFVEVTQLEQRHKRLVDRLHVLNNQGQGFGHNIKAVFEELADELTEAIENLIMRTDSDARSYRRKK